MKLLKRTSRVLVLLALPLLALNGGLAPSHTAVPAGFPAPPAAPAGAPNIIVIMTDDVGFASGSTFGGAIPTPTMDQLAANGLRYDNFHVNALCSPSRAALLTGRNAHAVGFGGVTDFGHGDAGYTTVIPKSAATIGQILKANGYDTAWFGKNHTIPTWQNGPLGPFDQWASGLGFDYFYGFLGGLSDQFHPTLVENNSTVEPPDRPDYILDRDLADHAIQWIRAQRAQGGGRPFLIHYAPGTAHGPLHAPADWIARFRGKFDAGWDALRSEIFARQKRLGVVPADSTIAAPPPGIPAWDSLTPDQKRLYARYMEVYAAALAFCDHEIGRIVDALRESGQLDNTIIVYIQGDNGASPEGGLTGAIDYAINLNGGARKPDEEIREAVRRIDEIGGPKSYPIAPVGWSVAMDTPFPYFKTVSSRLGGITNGMVISWPKGIKARGERRQFTHLVDILPTIIEAAHLTAPASINGVKQEPFDGGSFAYSFDAPEAPSRHRLQYFEVAGSAALYKDGWLAASPVKFGGPRGAQPPALDPQWELYDLHHDSSQTVNVAGRFPEKLRELRADFKAEAVRNFVLPINGDTSRLLLPQSRPEVQARPGHYVLVPSAFRYSESTFPNIKNRSWSVEADLDIPTSGGNGVLITEGGRFSGWGLTVLGGVPTFLYRTGDGDAELTRLAGAKLAPGPHRVKVEFKIDGVGLGRGGLLELVVDGKSAGQGRLERTIPFKFSPEGAAVGHDTGTPLVDDYRVPAAYDGVLRSVIVDLKPVQTP
jgi:arylsulfatase A-like enzyme